MVQIQCPNCGAYRVNEVIYLIDPRTKREFNLHNNRMGCLGAFSVVTLIASGVSGILLLLYDPPRQNSSAPITITGWGFLFLGFILLIALIMMSGIQHSRLQWKHVHKRSCQICGYQWSWSPGDPEPEVRVNPMLIQMGAQKLEEEKLEEERRRQMWD